VDLNETARDIARYRLARLTECDGQIKECPPGGHNVRNAALLALDPNTGEILAMLGSPDYFSARIDGAVNGTTALRQPGSSIKPLTYAAAFDSHKLTAATMMLDLRTSFVTREGAPYVPLNYDLQFRGPVRLREALASSYNLLAVKVLDEIGIETMTGLARGLGITTFDDPDRLGLSVTLGGGEVRLLELTAAYGAFANGGHLVHPIAIRRVEDENGTVLFSSSADRQSLAPRALDERTAYLVTDILSDDLARIPSFGAGSVLELSRPAAVKTGTTTDFRDNWTVGYTPDLVVGVWVGNADNEPMHNISGVTGAAPVWHDLMEAALKGQPVHDFQQPNGLVEVEVCALSGLLPEPDCPHRVTELFLAGTEPTETCAMHRRIAVDLATGLRATADTPPQQIAQRVYTILPPEAQDWAHAQGIPDPPPAGSTSQVAALEIPIQNPKSKIENRLLMVGPDAGAIYRLDQALPRESQRLVVSAQPADERTGMILTEVTLFVDGRPLARFSVPPYKAMWQLEPGEHRFWAEGVTADGGRLTSNIVQVQVQE
jgi:membrane carboxypeptidase/penicillin-binding protein PbpC